MSICEITLLTIDSVARNSPMQLAWAFIMPVTLLRQLDIQRTCKAKWAISRVQSTEEYYIEGTKEIPRRLECFVLFPENRILLPEKASSATGSKTKFVLNAQFNF